MPRERSAAPRALRATVLALMAGTRSLAAQRPELSGYYQNVGVGIASKTPVNAGALDAERARIMWKPAAGRFTLDAAYEQTLWWRDSPATGVGGALLSSTRDAGDWLHLGSTIGESTHASWRQRFDRLSVSYSSGPIAATLGRQTVSWATTLFLTPADPFVPFDPSDPFREYRAGVDAARLQWFVGPFTTVDLVARAASTPAGNTITALVRGKTTQRGWEMSAWGGALHDTPAGALGVTRTVAGSAVRAETEVRRDSVGRAVVRTAVGVDRRFSVVGRDLYAVIEYQHDPLGARSARDLALVAASPAAGRRELQVLGRDESAVQLTYQVHPLVSAELLSLWNLLDGSALLSPAVAISVSENASLRTGVFAPAGRGADAGSTPRSEYGPAPFSAYAALSVFF